MKCPECWVCGVPDEIAIHLIDTHGWETDKATVWLREQVERHDTFTSSYCCEECQWADIELEVSHG